MDIKMKAFTIYMRDGETFTVDIDVENLEDLLINILKDRQWTIWGDTAYNISSIVKIRKGEHLQ